MHFSYLFGHYPQFLGSELPELLEFPKYWRGVFCYVKAPKDGASGSNHVIRGLELLVMHSP